MADSAKSVLLADRGFRDGLVRFVGAKVPDADAEDIVQATLTDAIAAEHAPSDPEELRRWIYGIARHKIADYFRAGRHEGGRESATGLEASADSVPLSAKDLLQWAERELPPGDRAEGTLEWMLREGDGEKLEHIASERDMDAARVRQRVSRLRRYFRERWAAQLAAVAAVIVMVGAAWWLWRRRSPEVDVVYVPPSAELAPAERGRQLRQEALEECRRLAWEPCVRGLDEAAKLDPAGDRSSEVQQARKQAADALSPPAPSDVAPEASSSRIAPAPSLSAPPPVKPAPSSPTTQPTQTTLPKAPKKTSSDWGSSIDGQK